ncbi:major facilitator superfamily domain-containing protein [Clohesyomyces aquaticus]|uniref:Major facilitator superfamily domain-containing protein n=1 Tax=Clohesyomyces aquaticus TaxID=1231657 RepID=A0A1Y1YSG3_9PLEO|nr:major facilitator superfamily domain-containing protein [Clohesyomyces aquaticus]
MVGAFSGRALDAGLFRPTLILGISIQLVGIFTMSVAKTYWQPLLTQGICTGIGGGIFFCPVVGLVSTYFAKKRGMAIGIITTGNSVGGLIYPVVVRQLLDKVGFGWTVRVLGFINVVSLAVVLAFMKTRLPPRTTGPIIDTSAFRDPPYMIHILGMCFLMAPVYFVFYYIASFARDELDMSYNSSLNLVIILNGIGIPARVLPGFIADRYIGPLNTFSCCLLINVVMLWAWVGVHSIPSFYVFTIIHGLGAATFQSLFPTSIAALSNDITKSGTRLGMAFTVISFSGLVGGPISGALLKVAGGNYVVPMCWAASSTMIGMGLCMTARGGKHGCCWKTRC